MAAVDSFKLSPQLVNKLVHVIKLHIEHEPCGPTLHLRLLLSFSLSTLELKLCERQLNIDAWALIWRPLQHVIVVYQAHLI